MSTARLLFFVISPYGQAFPSAYFLFYRVVFVLTFKQSGCVFTSTPRRLQQGILIVEVASCHRLKNSAER